VLVELAYRCAKAEFSIREIPILFTERKSGDSKFSLRIFLEAYKNILKLRFHGKTRESVQKKDEIHD